MKAKIKFHFNEDSAAFENNFSERRRILNEALGKAKSMILKDEVPLNGAGLPLTDVNGNKVGELEIFHYV